MVCCNQVSEKAPSGKDPVPDEPEVVEPERPGSPPGEDIDEDFQPVRRKRRPVMDILESSPPPSSGVSEPVLTQREKRHKSTSSSSSSAAVFESPQSTSSSSSSLALVRPPSDAPQRAQTPVKARFAFASESPETRVDADPSLKERYKQVVGKCTSYLISSTVLDLLFVCREEDIAH